MSDNEETQVAPTTEKDPNSSVSASADGRETIYVRHPVLPELKKVILKRGFRIISADFAPDDVIIYNGSTGKPEGEESEDTDAPPTDKKPTRGGGSKKA
jgi:hypothetical protein